MPVTLRPTLPSDFLALIGRPPAYRCQCITAVDSDGTPLGLGGFLFPPGGDVWASVLISPAGRKYPVAIHRAGIAAMALARRQGWPVVYADAQPDNPAAERWLARLGFVQRDVAGKSVFVWERPDVE